MPARAQMVLSYLGVIRSQADLAQQLGTRLNIGTPHSHLLRLISPEIRVRIESGEIEDVKSELAQQHRVIVFVQAGELPQWRNHTSQHAPVVVGIDGGTVFVLDPAIVTNTDALYFSTTWPFVAPIGQTS